MEEYEYLNVFPRLLLLLHVLFSACSRISLKGFSVKNRKLPSKHWKLSKFSTASWRVFSFTALEFTIEPSDTVVPEGRSVLLQCAGHTNKKLGHIRDGKISPNIRWRGPDGQEIGIETFRVQLTNGSLYISAVNENQGLTGTYQCLLSVDGIGTVVSRTAKLSIAGKSCVINDVR